jgi:GNAT superfamily N-acetyltransferase
MISEDPIIRPARSGEAALLSDLALRAKVQRGQARGYVEELRDGECPTENQIVSEYTRIFVLEQTGNAIGFYVLKLQSRYEIELAAFFIESGHFGKGFWQLLLNHAKSEAAQLGAERLIFVESDPNVVALYMTAGVVFTGLRESIATARQVLASFKLNLPSAHVA